MDILRNGDIIHTVTIDKETVYSSQIMGEKKIKAVWVSYAPIDIMIGDYTIWKGETYSINLIPNYKKINNRTLRYEVTFEHTIYDLYSKKYMDEGDMDFAYTGTLIEFLELLMENINSISPGWSYTYDGLDTPIKTLGFQEESCRSALTRICQEFGVEYRCSGKHLTIKKDVGYLTTQTFEYGQGKGLYSLTRRNVDESGIVTRLYVFGGKKNITFDYRSGASRLMFANKGLNYIESNTELYGIREGSIIFEDIYPKRNGQVTSSDDPLSFYDLGLNFDINSQILEGQIAKVVFQSGDLMGNEFEIVKYDHTSKKITLKANVEESDYTLPNEVVFPVAGDAYTLVNIKIPESYISEAEAELLASGNEYASERNLGVAEVVYDLEIDPKYILDTGIEMEEANTVLVKDSDLGIDDRIRVHGVSYPLVEPWAITAVIANTIPQSFTDRVRNEVAKSKVEVREVNRNRIEDFRQSTMRLRQLQGLVYDADGYFDPQNIKPGSIETIMLAVGQKSQNLILDELIVSPTFGGDENAFQMSAASLIHLEYEIEGVGFDWELDLKLFEGLDPSLAYYVYARCSKTALTGTWEVSPEPILTEDETGFYHFWIGILYQVNNAQRAFEFTTGMTYIIGGQTVTGKIRSADGLNYIDLTQGKFWLGETGKSIDWNVTLDNQLYIDGALVAKMIFAEDAEIINLVVHNLKTKAEGKRIQILETENALKFINDDEDVVLEINDSLGTDLDGNVISGVRVNNPANGRTSWLSAGGAFSNASGIPFIAITTGIETNASVAGLLFQRNTDPNGISAGVAGIDGTNTGDSRSFGGYFNTALIGGLNLGSDTTAADYTIGKFVTLVSCYNDGVDIDVSLPNPAKKDMVKYVRRNNTSAVTILGNGNSLIVDSTAVFDFTIPSRGDLVQCYFDGSFWLINIMS